MDTVRIPETAKRLGEHGIHGTLMIPLHNLEADHEYRIEVLTVTDPELKKMSEIKPVPYPHGYVGRGKCHPSDPVYPENRRFQRSAGGQDPDGL